jgi:hypothetical protein
MAKLHTLKKSDKLDSIVDYGLQRVKDWTKKELEDLQRTSKTPICIALENGGYLVATKRVEKVSNTCWKVELLEFIDKRSAIFYCALNYLQMFRDAAELFAVDQKVGRYEMDKNLFRVKLDKAHVDQDQFKIDLYGSRYEEAKRQLVGARQDLEKIIAKAKYTKVL